MFRAGVELQLLVPKPMRERIVECEYWKCSCVAVSFKVTVEKARSLQYVGGTFGSIQKPTPFICLLLKLLQLAPSYEDVQSCLTSSGKYSAALGLFYARLAFSSHRVYELLEPFLLEYRRLRYRQIEGTYAVLYMDEFVERLLTEEMLFQVPLPHITRRSALVEMGHLKGPRLSPLLAELDDPEPSNE